MSRTDYNDLGDTFQTTFKETADKYFGIKSSSSVSDIKTKIGKQVDVKDLHIQNDLIVGAEIEDYDNFINDLKNQGEDLSVESSRNDLE